MTWLHLSVATFSLVGGGAWLARRKGTSMHCWLGRAWVAAMVLVVASSVVLLLPPHGFDRGGGLSIIQLLAAVAETEDRGPRQPTGGRVGFGAYHPVATMRMV